jgi:alginate O-acetyltransferase complex protein AlgI
MPFNSLVFLLFFLIVALVHSLPLPVIVRKLNLLMASYVFYAAWDVRYPLLLAFSTLMNFGAAALIQNCEGKTQTRRTVLWISVLLNFGLLACFKYGNEFLSAWGLLADRLRIAEPPQVTILLPIGLSFFTFQAMSYTIDIYCRQFRPTSLLDLAIFRLVLPRAPGRADFASRAVSPVLPAATGHGS